MIIVFNRCHVENQLFDNILNLDIPTTHSLSDRLGNVRREHEKRRSLVEATGRNNAMS